MRVPRPISNGKTPVAAGSRVPAWPTLAPPRRCRTFATTSWEVHPDSFLIVRTPSTTAQLCARSIITPSMLRPGLLLRRTVLGFRLDVKLVQQLQHTIASRSADILGKDDLRQIPE